MKHFSLLLFTFSWLCFFPVLSWGAMLPAVNVAVLKFGTVNWELSVIKRHKLDQKHGFEMNVIELVSPNATAVSLQSGESDLMVSDWLWVSKQHHNNRFYRYYPYSSAVGELMVACDDANKGLVGLDGKVLGVAGGSEGKSWLLFRAYTKKKYDYDLADTVEERFAAPPLLNGLLNAGQIDAVLNYWQYSARLKNRGYCPLLTLQQILVGLGVDRPLPMLGWVFKQQWAEAKPDLVNSFLTASYEAKQLLMESDKEWKSIRNMMTDVDDKLFEELRRGYRQGIPKALSDADIESIKKIYEITTGESQKNNMISTQPLPEKIFWRQFITD
jgi:NitT/TauT family transport system substrate-binding protein